VVSGALLWGAKNVDPKWIQDYSQLLITVSYQPHLVENPVGLKARCDRLEEGLREASEAAESLSRDRVEDILAEARRVGKQAENRHSAVSTFAYIFAGMTRADWTALSESALECSRTDIESIDSYARRLLTEGKSVHEVANLLGLARSTVMALRPGNHANHSPASSS
jgi:hypothetical protein